MIRWLRNIELKRILEEAVAQFKVLLWHLHGGTEENKTCQNSLSLGGDLNPGLPEYKA
jgi:hypothetical protein